VGRHVVVCAFLSAALGASACITPSRESPPSLEAELHGVNLTGQRQQGMKRCPSMVPGARTVIENRSDGVALTVTAPDGAGGAEIRRRARFLASTPPAEGEVEHTAEGTGGGKMGHCPVVRVHTVVSVQDVEGGAHILVKARHPGDVEALQRASRARVEALSPYPL
jgi:hypothetical protein